MSEKAAPRHAQIDTDIQLNDGSASVKEGSKKDANSDQLPPVPFLQLFRFQTRFETTLNIIGLVAAAAAGAAQPLMSLLFGKLTQAFVEFGAAVSNGEDVTVAAQHFKDLSAKDALYIFIIGEYAYWRSLVLGPKVTMQMTRQDLAVVSRTGCSWQSGLTPAKSMPSVSVSDTSRPY